MSDPVKADDLIDVVLEQILDERKIEHLDFETPCSIQYEHTLYVLGIPIGRSLTDQCEAAAVSTLTCTVCGAFGFVCEKHRTEIASEPIATCGACDAKAPGAILFRFAPLGGV